MTGAALKGRCMCGAVRVDATPERQSMSACHCDMCRQWTSGALVCFPVDSGSLKVEGPVRTYVSSDWAERAFCETCGSALWYRITAEGPHQGQTQLSAGLFANAGGLPLRLELYIDRKPEGYAFAGERRQMTEAEVIAAFGPEAGE